MSKKETSADTWRDRYDLAADRQGPMFDKFQSWYDMKQGHVNNAEYAAWRSKVVLPIISAKIDAMVAKQQGLDPGWEIGLYGDALAEEGAQDKADKAQWKLEHDWDNPKFDEPMSDKLYSPLVDAHVCGTGIGKVPWCFGRQTRYEKATDENGELDITKDQKITSEQGYNDFIPHDIMSTFIAPGAKNLYSAPWVILEDWVTYDDLVDENKGADGLLYDKNELKKIKDMKTTSDQFATQKASREMVTNGEDPLEADTTVNQFKRLECYERGGNIYTFVVGNNGESEESYVRIAFHQNIYWHGKYPLVPFYVKKRPHSFWGESVYETTERMQSGFSDLFNHMLDNLNLSQDGMYMLPEGENTGEPIIEPGGVWYYDQTKPEPFKFPEPNINGITGVMNFLQSQIENSTISSYAQGAPNSATDNTQGTATGIMRLQEAAGDKTGAYKKQFSNSLREIGRQWLSNNQQFIIQPVMVMGQVESKPAPVEVSPGDLQGEMVLRINDASMEPVTKEQKQQQFDQRLQQLAMIQDRSIQQAQLTNFQTKPVLFDFLSMAEDANDIHGQKNLDKVLLNEEETKAAIEAMQAQSAQMAQAAAPQEKPQQQPKSPSESINYKDVPEDVKRQIEAQAGLEPSQQLSPQAIDQVTRAHSALNGGNNGQAEAGGLADATGTSGSVPNTQNPQQLEQLSGVGANGGY